jgi:hypothetical protein
MLTIILVGVRVVVDRTRVPEFGFYANVALATNPGRPGVVWHGSVALLTGKIVL